MLLAVDPDYSRLHSKYAKSQSVAGPAPDPRPRKGTQMLRETGMEIALTVGRLARPVTKKPKKKESIKQKEKKAKPAKKKSIADEESVYADVAQSYAGAGATLTLQEILDKEVGAGAAHLDRRRRLGC